MMTPSVPTWIAKTASKTAAAKKPSTPADDDPFGSEETADSKGRTADRGDSDDDVSEKRDVAAAKGSEQKDAADDVSDIDEKDQPSVERHRKILDTERTAAKEAADRDRKHPTR